jgi:hypothetical protein
MGVRYDSPDDEVIRAALDLWKPSYQRVKLYLGGAVSQSQPNMAEVDFTQSEPTVRRWSSYTSDASGGVES